MSKYNEMCESYKNSQAKFFEYQESCRGFAKEFIYGFLSYIEIPKEDYTFVPTDKEPDPGSKYSLFGAMHLNEDTYYHIGIIVTLRSNPAGVPRQDLKFVLRLKQLDEVFLTKVLDDEDPIRVVPGDAAGYKTVYDHIVTTIKNFLENELQNFLRTGEQPSRSIGFCNNG